MCNSCRKATFCCCFWCNEGGDLYEMVMARDCYLARALCQFDNGPRLRKRPRQVDCTSSSCWFHIVNFLSDGKQIVQKETDLSILVRMAHFKSEVRSHWNINFFMRMYQGSWIWRERERKPKLSVNWTFGSNGSDHRAARTMVQPSMVLKLTPQKG